MADDASMRSAPAAPLSHARKPPHAGKPRPTEEIAPINPAQAADDRIGLADAIDRSLHAAAAHFTGGMSPAALSEAYLDWATHLTFAPGHRAQLAQKGVEKLVRFGSFLTHAAFEGADAPPCIQPLPQDRRFEGELWRTWPFYAMQQAFLLNQQWWHNATTGVRGVTRRHEEMAEFFSRQILDTMAPTNFFWTNPEVLQRTVSTGGANLMQGARNFLDDLDRTLTNKPPPEAAAYEVGEAVAVTPGKVVYRNRLIELIQYAPTTETVRPEPVLVVPAWIMKYYILDLSPENSLVRYLVGQGFTVFMISWKNPSREDRDLSLDDYRQLGMMAALETIHRILPDQQVHAAGYCLGGTLLSIAASAMARDGDDRLKSITLMAAQTDFTEAGELMLFINESQLSFLEDVMWQEGYLDASKMSGAFQMLRSNDLVWSRLVHDYLMGEPRTMNDLMAWNADTTRMPYRMHSEYLRRLFLDNDLAEGRFKVDGRPIALGDLRAPLFAVGTTRDHVAPWRSAYKIHLLTDTDVTFVLTSGGHNAGIVSEPGHPHRAFQVLAREAGDHHVDPDTFEATAPRREGSWWPVWADWLKEKSGAPAPPPRMGAPGAVLADAPGQYVRER